MMRPHVNLNKHNIQDELLKILNNSMHIFSSIDGIAGIILDGGLSRGYADNLSEIDLVIYLYKEQYKQYQSRRLPFALGISKLEGYLYDIKLLDYEEELTRDFGMVELWDLSYAKIMYDPMGKLRALTDKKLSKPVEVSQAISFMWAAYWNYKLAGDIWIYREDGIQGHFTLNNAIQPLLSALFIANNEYVPHDKWIVHMSKSLNWKPDDWEKQIAKAMSTGDFSIQSLIERQKAIDYIWNAIDVKLREQLCFFKELSITQKGLYEIFRLFIEKNEWDIHEWAKEDRLKFLNTQPFHNIISIESGKIIVNREKLMALSPDDMYSWFYDAVVLCRSEWKNTAI
jgi:predicted nucleotidyltransferase